MSVKSQAITERPHIPALDGLRGLAIVLVLIRHFMPWHPTKVLAEQLLNGFLAMGWVGVDIFFVLSGFLITGILVDAKQSSHYFRNFYCVLRLRIFPLYYAMVLLCTAILPALRIWPEGRPAGSSFWWWTYLSNIPAAFYPEMKPGWLGVFWSLAVEQHFYLVWPVVIYMCSKKSATRVCFLLNILAWVVRPHFFTMEMLRPPIA